MTWQEFKDVVDNHLDSRELDGSIEIWYIDISFPGNIHISTEGILNATTGQKESMLEVS